jgi:hypothetical protein
MILLFRSGENCPCIEKAEARNPMIDSSNSRTSPLPTILHDSDATPLFCGRKSFHGKISADYENARNAVEKMSRRYPPHFEGSASQVIGASGSSLP